MIALAPSAQAALFAAADEQKALSELPADFDDAHIVQARWNGRPFLFIDYLKERKSGPASDQSEYDRYLVAAYKMPSGTFRKINITTAEPEGEHADIVAIGFANADDDNAKELVVLVGWEQWHASVHGTLYEVRIYDDLKSSAGSNPSYLKEVSRHFDVHSCDCSWDDGRSDRYPFKTIAAIKRELNTLAINRRTERLSPH